MNKNSLGMFDGDPSIADIIENKEEIYDGDLIHYFKTVMNYARNLSNPYHNFRHMFYVLWTCYDACLYYMADNKMTSREARNLLVATIIHDFDHSGRTGHDDLNITRALRAFSEYHDKLDNGINFASITNMVLATKYPHTKPSSELDLCCQIIRDADTSQGLDKSWIQQVIFGLGSEMDLSPIDMLKTQTKFLSDLKFETEWAKERFSPDIIERRISEVSRYLNFLK